MRAFLLVALGGALGASARYATGLLAVRLLGRGFPVATVAVNVVGSFVLGWLLAETHRYALGEETKLALGTGLCGALTTFSTFSVETLRLIERGQWGLVLAYVAGNIVFGLAAAALGLTLGKA